VRKVLFAIALSTSLSLPQVVRANPAILPAVPAICATGVGCIFLGAVVVGGTAAYLWNRGGQRILTNAAGKVLRILEDPEQEDAGTTVSLNAKSWQAAKRECAWHFGYSQKFRVFMKKGRWYCTNKVD
jgi:hypothetical protein